MIVGGPVSGSSRQVCLPPLAFTDSSGGEQPEGARHIVITIFDVVANMAVVRIDSTSFVDDMHVVKINRVWHEL